MCGAVLLFRTDLFYGVLSWGTVSKALEKSRIPMSTCFPLSNNCSISCMVTTTGCVSQE